MIAGPFFLSSRSKYQKALDSLGNGNLSQNCLDSPWKCHTNVGFKFKTGRPVLCVCVTKAQSFSHGFPRPSCNLVGLREITKIYSQFHFLAVLKKGQIPLNSKYYFKH